MWARLAQVLLSRRLGILIDKFEKIKTDVAPFKPEAGDVVTWLEPKLVCEVAYQVLTRDMRLRMARFKRLRDDKPPEQCTLDQIIEVKKTDDDSEQKDNVKERYVECETVGVCF